MMRQYSRVTAGKIAFSGEDYRGFWRGKILNIRGSYLVIPGKAMRGLLSIMPIVGLSLRDYWGWCASSSPVHLGLSLRWCASSSCPGRPGRMGISHEQGIFALTDFACAMLWVERRLECPSGILWIRDPSLSGLTKVGGD